MFFRCTSNFSGFPKEDAAWQAHGPCTTCWDGATGQGTLQVYAACCHPLECEGPVKAWSSEQRPADQRSWVNWIKRGEPTRLTQILENRPKALMIIQHALTLTGGVQSLPWRCQLERWNSLSWQSWWRLFSHCSLALLLKDHLTSWTTLLKMTESGQTLRRTKVLPLSSPT